MIKKIYLEYIISTPFSFIIHLSIELPIHFVDNAEFAAGVKQSAKISFDDDVAPARRNKLTAVDKNNAINLDERINEVPDSNIKIEGELQNKGPSFDKKYFDAIKIY